jgi:hypothetical protein
MALIKATSMANTRAAWKVSAYSVIKLRQLFRAALTQSVQLLSSLQRQLMVFYHGLAKGFQRAALSSSSRCSSSRP